MGLNNRYVHKSLTLLILLAMITAAVALWRGVIPVEWLASFGYKGIFVLNLINSAAPVAGPSQIATFFVASKLNPLAVGITAGIGSAIGELAGYAFGYSFRASLSDESERKLERLGNWRFIRISRDRSFVPLFVLASVPNPFFDPVSALAGSLRIGLAKYFVPVLLGKTLRLVIIAFAGFYSVSLHSRSLAPETAMAPFIASLPLIASVILIALAAWLVRTFAESDPDPLILNFTFFAFAAQCILSRELLAVIDPAWVLGLLLVAAVLVLLQVLTIRDHADITLRYYRRVLNDNKTPNCTEADIEHWAVALVRITGRDFAPQFPGQSLEGGSRGKRRNEALAVLPTNLFKLGEGGIKIESFNIPDDLRIWRWWAYVGICVASWLVFLGCILIVRTHK
jgi:membrane protein YqaA with SNARE-associated domain